MPAYLEAYAEPETRDPHLGGRAAGPYGHVVVVPACGEGENLSRLLDSIPSGPLGKVLAVVVVNARDDHGAEVHAANAATLRSLAARAVDGADHPTLLVIDRASSGRRLPPKQGVGLARKIGHDVALGLRATGRIRSRFQHATDADALLPPDYFERVAPYEESAASPAALVYPYAHLPEPDPRAAAAITLYETWLRYHHLGLIHAGSPYAVWSIGSTIAVESGAYAVVRGFPRTMAGEDFYLLDKLAKGGWIERLRGAPIRLAGRASDRVPFGTGRSVRTLLAEGWTESTYPVLAPRGYTALGAWLATLEELSAASATAADLGGLVASRSRAAGLTPAETESLTRALHDMGAFRSAADSLRLPLTPANRRRRLHTNFDAFRTLKLLHALRDSSFGAMPLVEAVASAGFLPGIMAPGSADGGWAERVRRLEEARGRGPTGLLSPPRTPGSSPR